MFRGRCSFVISDQATPSSVPEILLTPIISALTVDSPVSPIIPALTQKPRVGGTIQLQSSSNTLHLSTHSVHVGAPTFLDCCDSFTPLAPSCEGSPEALIPGCERRAPRNAATLPSRAFSPYHFLYRSVRSLTVRFSCASEIVPNSVPNRLRPIPFPLNRFPRRTEKRGRGEGWRFSFANRRESWACAFFARRPRVNW
jgi:hypothetical protein